MDFPPWREGEISRVVSHEWSDVFGRWGLGVGRRIALLGQEEAKINARKSLWVVLCDFALAAVFSLLDKMSKRSDLKYTRQVVRLSAVFCSYCHR